MDLQQRRAKRQLKPTFAVSEIKQNLDLLCLPCNFMYTVKRNNNVLIYTLHTILIGSTFILYGIKCCFKELTFSKLKSTSKVNALKMLNHCLPLEGGAVCYFELRRTAFSISLSSSRQIIGHCV